MKKQSLVFSLKKAGFFLRDSRNLILRVLGAIKIYTLILDLTDRCNLKCAMCDIWEKKGDACRELDFNKARQMFGHKALRGLKHIYLTGGEPFLRNDLCEIALAVKDSYPRTSVTISSNGTLTARIMEFFERVKQYKNIGLEFSLLGRKKHDDVTGVTGSFENLENTLNEVRKKFPLLDLKAKFVITPWNYLAIEEAADYCREQNIALTVKMVENVRAYTNSLKYRQNLESKRFIFNAEQRESIIDALKKAKNNPAVDRICAEYLIESLEGREIKKKCFVPFVSLFINTEGNMYRCRMDEPIGNINKAPFNFTTAEGRFLGINPICDQCVSLLRFLM